MTTVAKKLSVPYHTTYANRQYKKTVPQRK